MLIIWFKGRHYWLGCKFKQCFSGICFKWLCYSSCKYIIPNILVCSFQIPWQLISSFWSIQWRLPDGMPISVLRGHVGAVTAIVFSPRPSAVYQLLSWAPIFRVITSCCFPLVVQLICCDYLLTKNPDLVLFPSFRILLFCAPPDS